METLAFLLREMFAFSALYEMPQFSSFGILCNEVNSPLIFSLQEKKSSQTYLQGGKAQSLKRKRRATELSEDSENIYPPSKVPSLSQAPYTESCHSTQSVDSACTPQHQTSPLKEQQEPATWSELRTATCFLTPSASNSSSSRPSPLPSIPWADGSQVWSHMCLGDQKTLVQRDPQMFQRHPTLQPKMRAILLDWLIEVCEVYKLHRETYYLAMDYIDRFLSIHLNVPKNQLQLIGITCLFIASKVCKFCQELNRAMYEYMCLE